MIAKIKQLPPDYVYPQGFTCPTGFWAAFIHSEDKPNFIDDRKWRLINYLEDADIQWEAEA